MRRSMGVLVGVAAVVALATYRWEVVGAESEGGPAVDAQALKRTRQQVRMLDDIYKTTVVLITDKYVNSEDDFPAGSAAIALFDAIAKKGWHTVRLLDATGDPYDAKNVAGDAFERQGVEKLKAGGDYYEQVIRRDGKPFLRAMTPIPVVLKKCTMCHPHYADAQPGEPIGALSYTVPIH